MENATTASVPIAAEISSIDNIGDCVLGCRVGLECETEVGAGFVGVEVTVGLLVGLDVEFGVLLEKLLVIVPGPLIVAAVVAESVSLNVIAPVSDDHEEKA